MEREQVLIDLCGHDIVMILVLLLPLGLSSLGTDLVPQLQLCVENSKWLCIVQLKLYSQALLFTLSSNTATFARSKFLGGTGRYS